MDLKLKRNLKLAAWSIVAIALMVVVFGIRGKLLANQQMNRLESLLEACQNIEADIEDITEHTLLFSKVSYNNRYNKQILGKSHAQFLDCVDSVQTNLNKCLDKVSEYENVINQSEREIGKLTKKLESRNDYERNKRSFSSSRCDWSGKNSSHESVISTVIRRLKKSLCCPACTGL